MKGSREKYKYVSFSHKIKKRVLESGVQVNITISKPGLHPSCAFTLATGTYIYAHITHAQPGTTHLRRRALRRSFSPESTNCWRMAACCRRAAVACSCCCCCCCCWLLTLVLSSAGAEADGLCVHRWREGSGQREGNWVKEWRHDEECMYDM